MVKKNLNPKIVGQPDLRIEEMYALVAQDENGDEGIMGASMVVEGQLMMMPLVGADIVRVKQWIPLALRIAKEDGLQVRVYHFRDKKDVTEEFLP